MIPRPTKDQLDKAKEKRDAIIADFLQRSDRYLTSYFERIPQLYKFNWLLSTMGKLRGLRAIKAKCLDCCAYDRVEVYNCTVKTCPLWHLRPKASNE